MSRRLIAWVVVLSVCYAGYAAAKAWKNPWQGGSSLTPVTALMPSMPDGCAKRPDCK